MIEAWTRVISLASDDLEAQHCYPLNIDLLLSQNLPRKLDEDGEQGWQPFFLGKDFVRTNLGITTDAFQLEDQALLQAGRDVSRHRKKFRERAEQVAQQIGVDIGQPDDQIQQAVKKIRQRSSTREPTNSKMASALYKHEPSLGRRRKLRGRQGRLGIADKISLVHSVLCDGEYQGEVARRFQVTQSMVSRLVKAVKKNPDLLDELLQLR